MKLDDEAWNRWLEWSGRVRLDLRLTLTDRDVFRRFSDVVRQNQEWIDDHHGGRFCEFVLRAYVSRVTLGVRRQSRDHKDAVSLLGILSQMQKCAAQFTFDFYLERFPREPDDFFWQPSTFEYVSEDGRVASERLIGEHINSLRKLTMQVEAFVDRELAHLDRRGFDGVVTFNDLDEALDALDKISVKYICLLTGEYRDTLRAEIQDPWMDIFNVPLQKAGSQR
jgi:hypothetical protein